MKIGKLVGYSVGLVALSLFVQGCASSGTSSSPGPAATPATSSPGPAASPAPNTASSPSASTAPKKAPTWMNAQGEVTDSKSVEAGYGQKVKGKDN